MTVEGSSIVWFRIDFRLSDNPALSEAVSRGASVIPLFIWSPEEESPWQPGGASRWWLHQSLAALQESLERMGSRLIIRKGPALEVLRAVAKESGADAVYWNRRYEPAVIARDHKIKQTLREAGMVAESFNGALLREPWKIANQSGKPFRVFTPFWNSFLQDFAPENPLPAPKAFPIQRSKIKSLELAELELEPKIPWADGMKKAWSPGEAGARANLEKFLSHSFADYAEGRDRPDLPGTSRLSPHLHFGEMTPRQIWRALAEAASRRGITDASWRKSRYLTEIGWREFSHHLLYHFPNTAEEPLRPEFKKFPWVQDKRLMNAWQKGRTGFPIVDAGMRELWTTGWMHNRVRMIVASFLVKDLLVSWNEGARWFWDTLVDADLAQNTLGWQWTAGCGADAAPYFRVFNPILQGEKFDPNGDYVRQWCPELQKLNSGWIHKPWEAPASELTAAGIKLGLSYPKPIVDHSRARNVALEAFAKIKSG